MQATRLVAHSAAPGRPINHPGARPVAYRTTKNPVRLAPSPLCPPHNMSSRGTAGEVSARAAATASEDSRMIDPAVHNQNLVRAAVAVAAVAAAAKATEFLPSHLVSFVHLVSLSTWLGTTVYTTLVIGIVLFKQLPRQTFGRVQSKLFPIYFGVSAACILLCLGTSFASGHMARMPVLLTALVSTLANLFLLEPVTTSVMYKIYDMENTDRKQTDEYKAARKKFGGLHGASSLVNLVGMVCAIMHCYALSVAMA